MNLREVSPNLDDLIKKGIIMSSDFIKKFASSRAHLNGLIILGQIFLLVNGLL